MQEWRETMARNSQELRDLGVKLSGFRSTFDTRRAAAAALPQITGGYTPGRAVAPKIDEIQSILRGFGLTLEQLAVIAQGVGVTILDSAGRVIPGALVQLNKALHDASRSVQEFGKSFEGQQRLADARLEIFDLSGPLDQLKAQYSLLAKTAPDLLKQFGLANLNLDSAGAQRVLEQGLRDVFDALQNGQLTADQLGGFADVGEFLDSLLGTDRALDGLADTASKVSDALTNVPQGFRIFNAELARFNAQAAATAASLTGSTPAAPPQTIGSDSAPWVPRTRPLEPAGPQVEYSDHRVTTFNVYQQPGENQDALVRRLEKMMDEKARRDNLTNGKLPTDPWSPRP
jgi:hypothetical protein